MSFLRLDDFTVPGFGLVTSMTLPFKDEDASGDTSSTSKASKGTKAKKLEAKIFIRFTDEDDLRALTRMAEAKKGGDGRIYTVTNRTANASGMRQGRFTGDFKAEEQEERRCWLVSFSLSEHVSVPERAEAREPAKTATAQQNEGQAVAPPEEAEPAQELTWFEKKLKAASDVLGDYKTADGTGSEAGK